MTEPRSLFEDVELDGFPIVRLDRYPNGSLMGSLEGVNEGHVDEYLLQFCEVMQPLFEVGIMSVKEWFNIVATRRNTRPDRNRLEAARDVAALVPLYARIRDAAATFEIPLRVDSYAASHVWIRVWISPGEIGIVELMSDGFKVGSGDSYHRDFSDERYPYSELEHELRKFLIAKTMEE